MPATTDAIRILILFIIPGFITQSTIRTVFPRRDREASIVVIEAIAYSCLNYALFGIVFLYAPLPSLGILQEHLSAEENVRDGLVWFFFFLVLPIVVGFAIAKARYSKKLPKFYRWLKLPFVNPYPRAWDYCFFDKTDPRWVTVKLADGTNIAGLMQDGSLASSYPEGEDIYLEKVYTFNQDGAISEEVPRTGGIWISGDQIKCIEFLTINKEDI